MRQKVLRAAALALAAACLSVGAAAAESHAPAAFAAPPAPRAADDDRVRPGEWSPKKVPAGWTVLETENYQVQSQIAVDDARRLAEHLEAMLDVYRQMLPFRKKFPRFILKIFRDRKAFGAYAPAGAENAAAYYDKANKELVGYDTGVLLGERRIPDRISLVSGAEAPFSAAELARLDELFAAITDAYVYDLADVLSHEGWHQYFHYYTVSWIAMPSWLDEGVGDYFFMARRQPDGSYRLGEPNAFRLRRLQRAFDEGTTVSFRRMLDFGQEDYYSNPSVFYAQGWSMVQFLMQHEGARRRALIPALIEEFKENKNFRKATEKAFKGLDLAALDDEWILWAATHPVHDPMRDLAREFGDRLPPASLLTDPGWREAYEHLLESRPTER